MNTNTATLPTRKLGQSNLEARNRRRRGGITVQGARYPEKLEAMTGR